MPLPYGKLTLIKLAGSAEEAEGVEGFPVEILEPEKTAVLRLPTSEQILARMAKTITIQQDEGRGRSKTRTLPNHDYDLELFIKLRLDKGEEFDKFEAAKAINKITYCRILSCERQGRQFRIEMETCTGGTVTHILNPPTEKQMYEYGESIVIDRSLGRGKTELKYRHDVAIHLYESLVQYVDGYSGLQDETQSSGEIKATVPAHHKFHAAVELANYHTEMDPVLDPNS